MHSRVERFQSSCFRHYGICSGRLWAVRGQPTTTDDARRRRPSPWSEVARWVPPQVFTHEATLRKSRGFRVREGPWFVRDDSRQPCLDGLKRTAISSVLVHSRTRETSSRALGWKPSSRTYDVGPLARCRASCPGTRTVARRDQLVGPAVGRMELHRPRGDQSPYSRARRIFLRADTGLRLSERPVFAFRASPLSLSV